ncbi:STAS domain-containing protein [Actinoplanes sp. TRM 88003]|uniref:STAS domain-containing protein n=1 Tax=Paractinoplanes aksuensis TaxID=2939490 RepID=A0ABT1DH96_9ACTN|nr:STAS domain-containing protein [Actinoplanes aksuensis]MCO8270213.1 STAS domain-containing protein [Actinoplanes aksuensis]
MLTNIGTTTAPGWPLEITAIASPAGARVAGEVDLATMPLFDLALELLAGCAVDVVMDLSAVTFIDIGGVRALAQATRRVRDAGRRLWLRDPSAEVRRMIDLLGWAALYDWEPGMSLATSAAVVPLRAERKPVPAHRLMVSASAA